ncbi:hypothetical protein ACSBPH_10115 [Microbacterium sp. F51-2R]|jgi:hypothetical protein|uniref:hypothetical protein n=1 Tax=Microbacterium sp. F51-2R TaxID=3445777 RepID=UPI003FA0EC42
MTLIDDGAAHLRLEVGEVQASWHEVDEGFWVANTDGAFLGTIELIGSGRYFARDATRSYVGEYPTLDLAQAAVGAAAGESVRGGFHASERRTSRGRASLR